MVKRYPNQNSTVQTPVILKNPKSFVVSAFILHAGHLVELSKIPKKPPTAPVPQQMI